MRSLKDILRPFIHALTLPASVWVIKIISIKSCSHIIGPLEAAAFDLVPILETKIFAQSDERPGFEFAAFDLPEPGKAILKVVNGAKVGATSCQRIQGAEIMLNGDVVVKPSTVSSNEGVRRNGWQ